MGNGYRVDNRSREDVIAQMRRAALEPPSQVGSSNSGRDDSRSRAPDSPFASPAWVDDLLADPDDPSAVLLRSLAGRFHRAIESFNTLPGRMREDYFIRRLGIAPRWPQPDRAYARLIKVAAQDPVRLARDTVFIASDGDVLKGAGGADADGTPSPPRRYRLMHGATATGMELGAVTSYQSLDDGRDALGHQILEKGELLEPCYPFNREEDVATLGVPRDLYICDPQLAAGRAGTRLRVTFKRAGPSVNAFREAIGALTWAVTTSSGYQPQPIDAIHVHGTSVEVTLNLEVDIEPMITEADAQHEREADRVALGQVAALRLHKPASGAAYVAGALGTTTSMGFESVELVFEGEDVFVSEGVINDALTGLDGPLAPLGDPALAGTSFYFACGGVFGLPLEELSIVFQAASGGLPKQRIVSLTGEEHSLPSLRPVVSWRRRREGEWKAPVGYSWLRPLPGPVQAGGDLDAFGGQVRVHFRETGVPFSEAATLGGRRGHWLRIRLERGDLGWSRFMREQEEFVRLTVLLAAPSLLGRLLAWIKAALGKPEAPPTPPARPVAPLLTGILLSFGSEPIRSEPTWFWRRIGDTSPQTGKQLRELYARGEDGVRRFMPFHNRRDGWGGELYIGFRGVESGESVGLYMDVATVAGVGARSNGEVSFRYYDGRKFEPLEAKDDTLGMTQAGVIRWRAPEDWLLAVEREPFTIGTSEPLHWVQVRVRQPSEALWLTRMTCDASELQYEVQGPDDQSSEWPVRAGAQLVPEHAIGGLVGAVLLERSREGTGPEPRPEHIERAGRRTRHRQRAVSPRDVEWLVLDEFPSLHLVHCCRPDRRGSTLLGPRVLLVPATSERLPTASAAAVEAVRRFLNEHGIPGVSFSVGNAEYAPVMVEVDVEVETSQQPVRVRERIAKALFERLVPAHRPRGGARAFTRPVGLGDLDSCVRSVPGVARVRRLAFAGDFAGKPVARARPGTILTSAPRHEIRIEERVEVRL